MNSKLEKYARKGKFQEVIEIGTQLYKSKGGSNITCLEYILNAYRQTFQYGNIEYLTRLLDLLSLTVEKTPAYCILHNEIGMCYVALKVPEKGAFHFKSVLSVKKDIPDVYNNLAVCYTQLKLYDKALVCLRLSLRLQECDNVYARLAELQFYMKQYDDSVEAYEKIQRPTVDNLYNKCFPYLARKDFLRGFTLYEQRLAENKVCPQTNQISRAEIPNIDYWNGIDHCGHLLVIYEQGIGDNIQYFRFVIELATKYPDMKVTYFCKISVSHLFDVESYDNLFIVNDSVPLDVSVFDKKVYIMSLPYFLKVENISPCSLHYIKEDSENNEIWNHRLAAFQSKLKVGLVYNGLLVSYIDKQINLADFKDICSEDRFQVICLHKMDSKIAADFENIYFSEKIQSYAELDANNAFVDTISILRSVDVLITIDTSIAHLAGVMGVKTLLLIGYSSDWRWFDTDEKVWYNSVEIVRMNENKSLSYLLPKVKSLLLREYESKFIETNHQY